MDPPEQSYMPSGPIRAHMFHSASIAAINGGQFIGSQTIVQGAANEDRLKVVYDTAAPNAILNQGGRADEVRCYPGTREEVLAKSEAWMDPPAEQQIDDSRKVIFWLSGPAGAGKSAIMQTLAERRKARGLPMVNFFFFRNDATRSDARPLVATILVQLFELYPDLGPLISTVLMKKPDIFRHSLHNQFQHLIDMPVRALRAIYPSLSQQPIVLLIDGLDECSSEAKHEQQALLKVLHDLVTKYDSPFLVYVASRAEPHLIMTFNKIGSSPASIFLNEDYRPEDDIRRFVTAELAEVKRTHHLGSALPEHWPPDEEIRSIVYMSSGQFIYAATVVRFISGSAASPAFSLDNIHRFHSATRSSPLAQLDAIYIYILSQVDDWNSVKDVLTANDIANRNVSTYAFLRPLGYKEADIPSLISDLTALVKLDNSGNLTFYHKSMTDFLHSPDRSGVYCIDDEAFCDRWTPNAIRCIYSDESLLACGMMLLESKPSASITEALLLFPTQESPSAGFMGVEAPIDFMGYYMQDYCSRCPEEDLYTKALKLWIEWFRRHEVIFTQRHLNHGAGDEYFVDAVRIIKSYVGHPYWDDLLDCSDDEEERSVFWSSSSSSGSQSGMDESAD